MIFKLFAFIFLITGAERALANNLHQSDHLGPYSFVTSSFLYHLYRSTDPIGNNDFEDLVSDEYALGISAAYGYGLLFGNLAVSSGLHLDLKDRIALFVNRLHVRQVAHELILAQLLVGRSWWWWRWRGREGLEDAVKYIFLTFQLRRKREGDEGNSWAKLYMDYLRVSCRPCRTCMTKTSRR